MNSNDNTKAVRNFFANFEFDDETSDYEANNARRIDAIGLARISEADSPALRPVMAVPPSERERARRGGVRAAKGQRRKAPIFGAPSSSPIEEMLHAALVANLPAGWQLRDIPEFPDCDIDDVKSASTGRGCQLHGTWTAGCVELLSLYRNVRVAAYRADLMVRGNCGWLVAIECDGHDFHDRTKQQAAYDRSRDRELLRLKIWTARFTGSEIYHSAERCASEVFSICSVAEAISNESVESFMAGQYSAQFYDDGSIRTGEEHW